MSSEKSRKEQDLLEAKRVLRQESDALNETAQKLQQDSFAKALDILSETTHKVIVTGIGKSGHVGKKIAATLCSTGTPATFLHPSEAVHGDLGIHQEGDAVIYLSNSGSTPELIFLEPVFRARKAKIVGLFGNINGPLVERVDVFLDASVEKEADNLGIVPTASYTVASSLGDAIASSLMLRRGFKEKDYARTHPAGQLGRNLILRVCDVMHAPPKVACVTVDTTMQETIIRMTQYPLGAACVLAGEELLGIITDGDLRRALQNRKNLLEQKASDVMVTRPTVISSDCNLGEALELMENRSSPVSVLPVVKNGTSNFIGLLRLHDIFGS